MAFVFVVGAEGFALRLALACPALLRGIPAMMRRPPPFRIASRVMLAALVSVAWLAGMPASGSAQAAAPFPLFSPEAQVRMAVQSLPAEELRAGATVLGYLEEGGPPVELRAGEGDFVCLLSPPGVWVVESACYHASLEPFMARGRELARGGMGTAERVALRNREADEGTLPLPEAPAALYITVAPAEAVDPETGTFSDAFQRAVIYVPYATGRSTGLSERAVQGAPWLMDAGTPRAHIMFTPTMALPEALQRAMQRGR